MRAATRDVGADGAGAVAYAERAGQLFRIAAQLKRIADQYQLAVVTLNQVSDVMTGPDGVAITPVCNYCAELQLAHPDPEPVTLAQRGLCTTRSPSIRADCAS